MNNYKIKKIKAPDYECIVWAMDYQNPLDDLKALEASLRLERCSGKILLDLLLSNGFNSDRFFECIFDGDTLQSISIKKVEPYKIPKAIQTLSLDFLSTTRQIDTSVLTKAEKFLVRKRKLRLL